MRSSKKRLLQKKKNRTQTKRAQVNDMVGKRYEVNDMMIKLKLRVKKGKFAREEKQTNIFTIKGNELKR